MPIRLDTGTADFAARFAAFLATKREIAEDVEQAVRAIIADVRTNGDRALVELSRKFDRIDLIKTGFQVSRAELDAATKACDRRALDALKLARERIEAYHRRQKPSDDRYTDPLGVELGHRWTAIEAVGLYVPGGTAAYPSSVLMNAVPAKVAGVPRVVMVVPAPDGKLNPLVLAAAELAGVDEIYRIGGAQAVAALAYGTETIKPVAKIVGPGNAYVAAAKRVVFGTVGIDMIAGPSEVLILADSSSNPDCEGVNPSSRCAMTGVKNMEVNMPSPVIKVSTAAIMSVLLLSTRKFTTGLGTCSSHKIKAVSDIAAMMDNTMI